MSALLYLHDQLRNILNDLVFTFDTAQKEKLIKKSITVLDNYLSQAESKKAIPLSIKSNKENIPLKKAVTVTKRPVAEKPSTKGNSQNRSLK